MRTISNPIYVRATRSQLAKLGEVLVAAFQAGELPSKDKDEFKIEIDDNPAVYCLSNTEAICHLAIK